LSKKEIPTFKQYTEKWLAGYGESSLKYSSLISYKSNLIKHIYPIWENNRLDTITRAEIREFIFKKAKELHFKRLRTW